jgi:hypothetical protein
MRAIARGAACNGRGPEKHKPVEPWTGAAWSSGEWIHGRRQAKLEPRAYANRWSRVHEPTGGRQLEHAQLPPPLGDARDEYLPPPNLTSEGEKDGWRRRAKGRGGGGAAGGVEAGGERRAEEAAAGRDGRERTGEVGLDDNRTQSHKINGSG